MNVRKNLIFIAYKKTFNAIYKNDFNPVLGSIPRLGTILYQKFAFRTITSLLSKILAPSKFYWVEKKEILQQKKIRDKRISRLAEIPSPLSRLAKLTELRNGLIIFVPQMRRGLYEGHLLNYTISPGISFYDLKSLLVQTTVVQTLILQRNKNMCLKKVHGIIK